MDNRRVFEQTEITKILLTALKSFRNKGRVNNAVFGSIAQTYHQDDVNKCAELIENIERNRLDVRLVPRDE